MVGGLSLGSSSNNTSHPILHKIFLLTNYALLGSATSCIFLTLSLRLIPSLVGFFFILLHLTSIAAAVSGCSAASHGQTTSKILYGTHWVATVLTAIFQGAVSVLIFTRPSDFLNHLKSYVREEDGVVILKLAGGLCVLMFCLEWVVLTLAFFLKYYAYVERNGNNVQGNEYAMRTTAKVGDYRDEGEEDLKTLPWPFRVV